MPAGRGAQYASWGYRVPVALTVAPGSIAQPSCTVGPSFGLWLASARGLEGAAVGPRAARRFSFRTRRLSALIPLPRSSEAVSDGSSLLGHRHQRRFGRRTEWPAYKSAFHRSFILYDSLHSCSLAFKRPSFPERFVFASPLQLPVWLSSSHPSASRCR